MITRRNIFGVIAGLAASVVALPAIALGKRGWSLPPHHEGGSWAGKLVHVSMKIVGEDETLECYAEDSEILDVSLSEMRDMMSDYINHGTKE